jgi:hypothetical protein
MDKQTRIEKIEELLKSGTLYDTQKAVLMKQLSTLQGSSAPVATSGNAMQSLNTLANLLAQEAGLDEDEVRRIAEQTFGQSQITLNQLSPEVKDFIDKTKTTTITVLNVQSPTQQKATTSQTSKEHCIMLSFLILRPKTTYIFTAQQVRVKRTLLKRLLRQLDTKLLQSTVTSLQPHWKSSEVKPLMATKRVN